MNENNGSLRGETSLDSDEKEVLYVTQEHSRERLPCSTWTNLGTLGGNSLFTMQTTVVLYVL